MPCLEIRRPGLGPLQKGLVPTSLFGPAPASHPFEKFSNARAGARVLKKVFAYLEWRHGAATTTAGAPSGVVRGIIDSILHPGPGL